MPKRQFNLKTLLVATSVIALIVCVTINVVNQRIQANTTTRSTHATQVVAFMCVNHMIANDQKWPRNWADLKDDFQSHPSYAQFGERGTPAWTMADLQRRVEVNWNPDLNLLASDPSSNSVIWISNQRDRAAQTNLSRIESLMTPNEIVARHLVHQPQFSTTGVTWKPSAIPIQSISTQRPWNVLVLITIIMSTIAAIGAHWHRSKKLKTPS